MMLNATFNNAEVYNIMCESLSATCDKSIVFSGSSGFFHPKNWAPRYNWNIVERGVKHHQANKTRCIPTLVLDLYIP
jgi:hypothetical protein